MTSPDPSCFLNALSDRMAWNTRSTDSCSTPISEHVHQGTQYLGCDGTVQSNMSTLGSKLKLGSSVILSVVRLPCVPA